MRHLSPARRGIAALLALALALSLTTIAAAHAKPVTANINPGAVLTAAPAKLTITFGEETDTKQTKLGVADASGKAVDKGDTTVDFADPKTASVSLPASLPDGTYTVSYHTLTDDDNGIVNGTYTFSIAANGTVSAGNSDPAAFNPQEAPDAAPDTGAGGAQTATHVTPGFLYIALLLLLVAGGSFAVARRRR